MELISTSQHHRYKEILDKIDEEYKKHDELKQKILDENNKLTAVRVATEAFSKKRIFQTFVRIHNSIFDVCFIYGNNIVQADSTLKDCDGKFYVVELVVSNTLIEKLKTQKFLLHVNIKNSSLSVNKTIAVQNKSSPFLLVVPYDTSLEPATVTTSLYVHHGDTWCQLHLSHTSIDLSYHFTSLEKSWNDNYVIKIAQQYHADLKDNFKSKPIDYNFKCACATKHFFESTVKNCYHQLNPELFVAFTKTDAPSVSTSFTVDGNNKVAIKLDRLQSVLSLTCNIYDLDCVKKYFINEIKCEKAAVEKMWVVAVMNLKQYLRAELGDRAIRCKEVLVMYQELQKLIYELPV